MSKHATIHGVLTPFSLSNNCSAQWVVGVLKTVLGIYVEKSGWICTQCFFRLLLQAE